VYAPPVQNYVEPIRSLPLKKDWYRHNMFESVPNDKPGYKYFTVNK